MLLLFFFALAAVGLEGAELADGAVVLASGGGDVAGAEGECGSTGGGGLAEGEGGAGEGSGLFGVEDGGGGEGVVVHLEGEDFGFVGDGAVVAPHGGGGALDVVDFGLADGAPVLHVGVEHGVEGGAVFG